MPIQVLNRPVTSGAINAALSGATLTPSNLRTDQNGWIGWSSNTSLYAPASASISLRDYSATIRADLVTEANDILALRRGTNAQSFRVYNTYTDASNYERLTAGWSSNIFQISAEAAGTGTTRAIRLNAQGVQFDFSSAGLVVSQGISMTNGVFQLGGNVFQMTARTDPGASAASKANVFLRDNGSGKMQIAVRFPTGAIQLIATEP